MRPTIDHVVGGWIRDGRSPLGSLELSVSGGIRGTTTTYVVEDDLDVVKEETAGRNGETDRRTGSLDAAAGADLLRSIPGALNSVNGKRYQIFDGNQYNLRFEWNGQDYSFSFDASNITDAQRELVRAVTFGTQNAVDARRSDRGGLVEHGTASRLDG